MYSNFFLPFPFVLIIYLLIYLLFPVIYKKTIFYSTGFSLLMDAAVYTKYAHIAPEEQSYYII